MNLRLLIDGYPLLLCAAPWLSFLLDLLFGDPPGLPHPVVLMGKMISLLEKGLRRAFPATGRGERAAGAVLALAMPLLTFLITGGICFLIAGHFGARALPALFLLDIFWGYQAIAVKDMLKESRNVYECLCERGLMAARTAVGRIVGRDTGELSEKEVIRAAIESTAESFSDGMLAPMFYLSLFGAPASLCYKSINTMDSMVGYKNDRYRYFGWAAAKLDDIVNFIPSRIAGLLITAAAFICQRTETAGRRAAADEKKEAVICSERAFKIWKRDRLNHLSPNSAQTEAAMAGALGVRLGGGAEYFGKFVEKPFIGDALREVEREDILRANRIYLTASVLGTALGSLIRIAICLLFLNGIEGMAGYFS